MTVHRKVTYTEKVSVALAGPQLEQLRRYARERKTAMSIVMREQALIDIGRKDLSLAEQTKYPIGAMLDRAHKKKPAQGRFGARVLVNMTEEQRTALARAAIARGTTISNLLRAAALKVAGIAQLKPLPLGRPLGH